MHLKSLTLKGFKSFPERTTLDFGPGVSVVVGPNGSGKSNVTDAVLWAMGEQSPLAVRGQSMQDVIFGGGRGVAPRSFAEVEIVLDNADGTIDLPLGEISIARRLERSGEGGYRLNGARCRLIDVIDVLSDTGLGKETHSVISQGRVEAIVTSRPRDRRMLIEEAAGLGKHRKRRRRAQLKLERTQENLDRALDVEREARTRLRPLKRQSEAAELHERLERQILDARLALSQDACRSLRAELREAEHHAAGARAQRERAEAALAEVARRRALSERALSERAERHDALSRRAYEARAASERLALRAEQAGSAERALRRRVERVQVELDDLTGAARQPAAHGGGAQALDPDAHDVDARVRALRDALAQLEQSRERELEAEVAGLREQLARETDSLAHAESAVRAAAEKLEHADARATQARENVAAAEREVQRARREAARVGAELAAANQFLRAHAGLGACVPAAPASLSRELGVREGFELAVAAALGGRLDAALVDDVTAAHELLDRAGPDGGAALLAAHAGDRAAGSPAPSQPCAGAVWLPELLSGAPALLALARRLLADAWVVETLDAVARDFRGVAVTREGRVWFAAWGEMRQLAEGGGERVLARRNERERLLVTSESAAAQELAATAASERAAAELRDAESGRALTEEALRERQRAHAETAEAVRRCEWLIEQRRSAPAEGALAVRKAEIEGELAAEERQLKRRTEERAERQRRLMWLHAQRGHDDALAPAARRLTAALAGAAEAVEVRVAALEQALAGHRAAGEQMGAELRDCAEQEAGVQGELRAAGEAVTAAEVAAQRIRDQVAEAEAERLGLLARLDAAQPGPAGGDGAAPVAEEAEPAPLDEREREALCERVSRLQRRREQLGPVNPLAQQEYADAVAHVEELETRREDLEGALRELRGVIRDTDRQIEEAFTHTFQAAARNFEGLVADVFPGGSGSLRLVSEERGRRTVLGGQELAAERQQGTGDEDSEEAAEAEAQAQLAGADGQELPGVEIEVTPAGKATKRLSLLSGGEKSMTALAFLFAVFLARPCPFYILDEVEAALDDLNLDRFLSLLRRHSGRAQFIVITHQKRTMEAADWLYGVSMGADGVSKVLSRRLPREQGEHGEREEPAVAEVA